MMDKIMNNPAALYLIWIFVMSVILFILMGTDKLRAVAKKRRVPEKTLFIFAILGGALGGTIAMYSYRHKTKHWYFALFFPVLAAIQFVILFLMIAGII